MLPQQRPAHVRNTRLRRLLLAPALITAIVAAISLVETVVSPHGVTLELRHPSGRLSRTVRVLRVARQEVNRRARGMGSVSSDIQGGTMFRLRLTVGLLHVVAGWANNLLKTVDVKF